jgi:hypothetical protein
MLTFLFPFGEPIAEQIEVWLKDQGRFDEFFANVDEAVSI